MVPPTDYFEQVKPTYMESWYGRLHGQISVIPAAPVELTRLDMIALGHANGEFGECFDCFQMEHDDVRAHVAAVRSKIDDVMKQQGWPEAFIRLGSRSPKDSYNGYDKGFKVTSGQEALSILLASSERVYKDLILSLTKEYLSLIWMRPWVNIVPRGEFRCFIVGGKCVGVSEYIHAGQEPEGSLPFDSHLLEIKCSGMARIAADEAGFRDVIADVVFVEGEGGVLPMFLEFNPLFGLTDPCLYSWDDPTQFFPGSIRVAESVVK